MTRSGFFKTIPAAIAAAVATLRGEEKRDTSACAVMAMPPLCVGDKLERGETYLIRVDLAHASSEMIGIIRKEAADVAERTGAKFIIGDIDRVHTYVTDKCATCLRTLPGYSRVPKGSV